MSLLIHYLKLVYRRDTKANANQIQTHKNTRVKYRKTKRQRRHKKSNYIFLHLIGA